MSARFPTVGVKFDDILMGSSEESKSLEMGGTITGSGLGGAGSIGGGDDGGRGEDGVKGEDARKGEDGGKREAFPTTEVVEVTFDFPS
jgi:hypothetical protein